MSAIPVELEWVTPVMIGCAIDCWPSAAAPLSHWLACVSVCPVSPWPACLSVVFAALCFSVSLAVFHAVVFDSAGRPKCTACVVEQTAGGPPRLCHCLCLFHCLCLCHAACCEEQPPYA